MNSGYFQRGFLSAVPTFIKLLACLELEFYFPLSTLSTCFPFTKPRGSLFWKLFTLKAAPYLQLLTSLGHSVCSVSTTASANLSSKVRECHRIFPTTVGLQLCGQYTLNVRPNNQSIDQCNVSTFVFKYMTMTRRPRWSFGPIFHAKCGPSFASVCGPHTVSCFPHKKNIGS